MPKFVSPTIKRLRSTAGVDKSAGKTEENIPASPLVVEATSNVSSFDDVFNKFGDLEYFLELVEVEQTTLTSAEQEIRLESWRRIHDKGVEICCDWSNQACDRLEQMWEACASQTKELNLAAVSATSGMRSGMKRQTYDDINRFLRTGEYPVNIADDYQRSKTFRIECAEYSINSKDQIEYSGRGPKKIVLLEGEVEPVVRHVHYALGHANSRVVGESVSARFYANCNLNELTKVLVGRCTTDCERLGTLSRYKSMRITFQRTPHLHIEVLLNNKRLSQSDMECVLKSSDNVARVGMPISNYKRICASLITKNDSDNNRKNYKFDQQKGLLTSGGKIVLDDSVGADVVFQIHNIYGHVTYTNLKDLVSLHFYCPGVGNFSGGIRSFCSFCSLRSGNTKEATPSEVYRNANYNVVVNCKDGQRKISISPIGLDQTLVDTYVEGILKKNNTTMEQITTKQAPQNVKSEMMPIQQKILELSSLLSNIKNRPSINTDAAQTSTTKRRKTNDELKSDDPSLHGTSICKSRSSCEGYASQIKKETLDTAGDADMVLDCQDVSDCLRDYVTTATTNVNWTRDFERSYDEFAVSQSEEYEAPLETFYSIYTVTPTSPGDLPSRVNSNKLDQMGSKPTEGILKEYDITSTSEGSFIELQPVIQCPQYLSPPATVSFEDFYRIPYEVDYPAMSSSVGYPLATGDSLLSSIGQEINVGLFVSPNPL